MKEEKEGKKIWRCTRRSGVVRSGPIGSGAMLGRLQGCVGEERRRTLVMRRSCSSPRRRIEPLFVLARGHQRRRGVAYPPMSWRDVIDVYLSKTMAWAVLRRLQTNLPSTRAYRPLGERGAPEIVALSIVLHFAVAPLRGFRPRTIYPCSDCAMSHGSGRDNEVVWDTPMLILASEEAELFIPCRFASPPFESNLTQC